MILDHSGSIGSCSSEFDQVVFRELLSVVIVKHGLPFQFVKFDAIRTCFEFLNSDIQNISRNTAKANILKAYNAERLRIKAMLGEVPGRICFTSDLWTACTTDGYMSLTAHFIDKNWVLQKRLLNITLMPFPLDFKKVFSITLDNASVNKACVTMLKSQLKIRKALLSNGDYLHMRCCAHIFNLIVQDGLKAIKGELYKIRRKQKFLECVNQMSLHRKKGLRQDVPIRWNSTYIMLDCALYYKSAFFHLALSDSNYRYCPLEDEGNKLERINNFLYPTSNLYFPKVFAACLTLREYSKNGDGYMKDMGKRMLEKFLKYWSEFCTILTMAVILDSRYKLQFVEWAYKKVYGENSNELKNIREKLFSLFNEYMLISTESTNTSSMQGSVSHSNENDDRKGSGKLDSCLDVIVPKKTQLELYWSEPRAYKSSHLDILSFRKDNQVRYSELASMARDVLTIPISTVASESAFSVGVNAMVSMDELTIDMLEHNN
ncbi:BED-type domain-containing protein [Citrus sinensis]|nr:BED-type domain-containing protein [Citrus sinensis]